MPQNKHARFLLILVYIVLGALGGWLALPWLAPFILAFLLAALLERPVGFLIDRLKFSRWVAALCCTLLLTALVLGGLALLLWRIAFELGSLAEQLPLFLDRLPPLQETVENMLYRFLVAAPIQVQAFLKTALEGAQGITLPESLYTWFFGALSAAAGAVPRALLFSFTAVLATYFISARRPQCLLFIKNLVPVQHRDRVARVKAQIVSALGDWLRVQGILLLVCFSLLVVGLLALRIDAAVLIAAATSLLDALPLFGVGTVLVPWAIFSLLAGNYVRGFCLLALFSILWLERSILEPKLMGDRTGLPPLGALLALYGGFQFFGIAGMILSPLAAIVGWQFMKSKTAPPQ